MNGIGWMDEWTIVERMDGWINQMNLRGGGTSNGPPRQCRRTWPAQMSLLLSTESFFLASFLVKVIYHLTWHWGSVLGIVRPFLGVRFSGLNRQNMYIPPKPLAFNYMIVVTSNFDSIRKNDNGNLLKYATLTDDWNGWKKTLVMIHTVKVLMNSYH